MECLLMKRTDELLVRASLADCAKALFHFKNSEK